MTKKSHLSLAVESGTDGSQIPQPLRAGIRPLGPKFYIRLQAAVRQARITAKAMTMYFYGTKAVLGTRKRTGETCPESGVWKVDDAFQTTTAPIARGNTFPPYRGNAVWWILVQYA